MPRDWVAWHAAYDSPTSMLSRRLEVVVAQIEAHVDAAPVGPLRCLSLCCGDARDLVAALRGHRRRDDVTGRAVELDPRLADAAARSLAEAGIGVDVQVGDAGATASYAEVVPVDLLLLVGIFGNISVADVDRTIDAVPQLCRPGATVIWTRHRRAPDRTPAIRAAFEAAGCAPVAFVSPGVDAFAVGVERVVEPVGGLLPARLFTFEDRSPS